LEATVKADEAAVRSAQVQLGYTFIRSPIDGQTGGLNVYQGTVVKANDAMAIVTIAQLSPIYVSFAVPEKYLPEISKFYKESQLKVKVTLSSEERFQDEKIAEEGLVTFINNSVDSTTGTITLRATFNNADRKLWPGRYVNVSLRLGEQANA